MDYFSYQNLSNKTYYRSPQIASWVKSSRVRLKREIKSIKHQEFLTAIVSGEKRRFKKYNEYDFFKKAQLLHILTPSGIHLAAILLPIFFFIRSLLLRQFVFLIFGALLFYQPQLAAAKRMWVLRLFNQCSIPIKLSFLMTSILSILTQGGLSLLFSYLFLGSILFNPFKKILSSMYILLIAQVLTSYFMHSQFYPLSFLINPITTTLTALIFPIIVLTYIFPVLYPIIQPLIDLIFSFVSLIDLIPPIFSASLISCITLLSFLYKMKFKWRILSLIILLSQPVYVS